MKLPELVIGDIKIKVPIVLGAMGVGVTRSKLASAITNAGGLGVISGVNLGYLESDFINNRMEANLRALRNEIRKAKALASGGAIGINFMVAMNAYAEHVREAVKEGIDFIVSGAGLPTELPSLVKGSSTKIAPIVSSKKAAELIAKLWDRNYGVAPDAVVLEGIEAGGHLGFKMDELNDKSFDMLQTIKDIKACLTPYEIKYQKNIPLIVAGGIFDGQDIANVLTAGADGVQMATRFVATEECDADEAFKQAYIAAKADDVKLIVSPVGMPGRAISNAFLNDVQAGVKPPIKRCVQCLKTCDVASTPYCISQALVNSVTGDVHSGLIFAGSNVYKVKGMSTVPEIFKEILQQVDSL